VAGDDVGVGFTEAIDCRYCQLRT